MAAPVHYTIHNHTFWLLPQKALYWEEGKALIISDLHLGKTGHFRKEGIPVPQGAYKKDLHCLFHIIQYYKPEQLIIAGDMFHSKMNREVDLFTKWRNDIAHVQINLIKGNHDILEDGHYTAAGITVSHKQLQMGPFCFVHDVGDVNRESATVNREAAGGNSQSTVVNRKSSIVRREAARVYQSEQVESPSNPVNANLQSATCNPQSPPVYYFSGHIHPAIVVKSASRQALRFPCFYFTASYAVLPAFSAFSGHCSISPQKNEKVFAVVNGSVIKM